MTSTKPYIVRAFYEWISDNEMTPYIVVDVSVHGVLVPLAFVNDGQIILNVSMGAVGSISMDSEHIQLSARFGGKLEQLTVPYGAIAAIYAKENGAGTSLEIEHPAEQKETVVSEEQSKLTSLSSVDSDTSNEKSQAKAKSKGRASLKVVK